MRAILSCLAIVTAMAPPALAIDLATNALVEIVQGVSLVEAETLDFGRLVLNDGTVTVNSSDGSLTDAGNLVINAVNVSQAVFNVTSVNGADLTASAVTGAGMPPGLLLHNFVFDWDNGTINADYTISGSSNARLEVGADLTVTAVNASVTAGAANLPYTMTVVFQ